MYYLLLLLARIFKFPQLCKITVVHIKSILLGTLIYSVYQYQNGMKVYTGDSQI